VAAGIVDDPLELFLAVAVVAFAVAAVVAASVQPDAVVVQTCAD
jgi:hypothetical protein